MAQASLGIIPNQAAIDIAGAYPPTVERVANLEQETHHDLVSAMMAIQEKIGLEGQKFLHFGLTSSDVVDTALALRLRRCIVHWQLVIGSRDAAYPWSYVKRLLAVGAREISVGKLSGAVGNHNDQVTPRVEQNALEYLKLKPELKATQIISRDHHAAYTITIAGAAATLGGSLSWQVIVALENMAVWGERDISHSSAERIYLYDLCRNFDILIHQAIGVKGGPNDGD